jgi:hypothetical protein
MQLPDANTPRQFAAITTPAPPMHAWMENVNTPR